MTIAAERLSNACFGHDFPTSSVAGGWEADKINELGTWRGSPPVSAVMRAQFSTDLAALDQMRATATLMRAPTPGTVALATLTRGALEAFARMNYILASGSARTLIRRHGEAVLADLKYPAKFEVADEDDAPVLTQARDGATITAADLQESIRRDLYALRVPERSLPDRTALVRQLLDSALGRTGGHVRYSTLSAIAHGESIAVNAFLTLRDAEKDGAATGSVGFETPRDFAIDYSVFLIAACRYVHTLLIEKCSPPRPEMERWEGSAQRAASRIQELVISRNAETGTT